MSIVALIVSVDEINEEHADNLIAAIKLMAGVTSVDWTDADTDYYAAKMNARYEIKNELRKKLRELQECLYEF